MRELLGGIIGLLFGIAALCGVGGGRPVVPGALSGVGEQAANEASRRLLNPVAVECLMRAVISMLSWLVVGSICRSCRLQRSASAAQYQEEWTAVC